MGDSYGPALPPHLAKKASQSSSSSSSEDEDSNGRLLGPELPPHLRAQRAQEPEKQDPDPDSDSDDGEMIGPLPPKPGSGADLARRSNARDIESRADRMKAKIEGRGQEEDPKRESWMLQLPPEKAKNFGLGPRSFRANPGVEKSKDRSCWTDTPEVKAKKAKGEITESQNSAEEDKDVLEYLASLKRDEEMERISKELSSKRGNESLMDLHSKKLKKDKKDSKSGADERRPFDRDVDLQANRFDAAQKELMMKRARQLNDKFSSGGNKYL